VMSMCGGPLYNVEVPDAGEGACCMGAAFYGPERCTCWKPIYDRRQRRVLRSGPPVVRPKACGDCAFRPDSPERAGASGYQNNDPDELAAIAHGERPFFCHQGIRHALKLRHPNGVEVAAHAANYDPPIVGQVPYKANGLPADICAGWAARAPS
jgi:hypothetical protein